jgi:diguanylate cyclase (GGDEF)-like protein
MTPSIVRTSRRLAQMLKHDRLRVDDAQVGENTPGSWLCRTDAQRERAVDMERRLKRPRAISFGILALALLSSGPWVGWWTLAPMALAVVGFTIAGRLGSRVRRPEWAYAGAFVVAQLVIAFSVALTGGHDSPATAWLVIPVVTLSARFDGRGLMAGMSLTIVLMIAATFGVDPAATLAAPQTLIFGIALLLAVVVLLSALMRSDLEHRSESVLDGLTGMLNRRSLDGRIAELEQQAAITGETIGLVVGDIDNFKAVNDVHGHVQGDAVLIDVAYTLRKELRAFDLAYRIGGEEFLVVLPGAGMQDAADVAERLRLAVELSPAGGLRLTMSFGVATSSPGPFAFVDLFGTADAALYEAKRAGRNRVVTAAGDPRRPVPA